MVARTQSTFPNFRPTQRPFVDPTYPIKYFTTLGGIEYARIYGSEPSGYQMQLTFVRPNADCLLFRSHYHFTRGGFQTFTIPSSSNIWSGLSASDAADFATDIFGGSIQWRYDSPPRITPLPGGGQYSTVEISLIGVVRGN